MDKDVETEFDLINVAAWVQLHRQRIVTISAAVIILGAVVGFYAWHQHYVDSQAELALSTIQIRTGSAVPDAAPFLKVDEAYPKTGAAARALLIAGGYLFEAGKFDQAGTTFRRFLTEYPENSMANQALLGEAASAEAAGNLTNAASLYDELIKRHQMDSTTPQAKSALARIYVAENKPERALELYQDLVRANNNDTWSAEASVQAQELLTKYPNLKKAAVSASASPTVNPVLPLLK